MAAAGFAFRQFVVKLHSRCNLACDHCYIYEHADQSWRDRPVVMSDDIMTRTAWRIAEHCRAHLLPSVHVILHGGEPLLAGPVRIRRMARLLRDLVPSRCALDLRLQTNGLLLDDAFCQQFVEDRVMVGISVDGDEQAHDLHRKYRSGRGSYDEVVTAVRRLNQPRYRSAFAGLLCTVDPDNDPIATYEALVALDPPRIELLLPHATWEVPPAGARADATVYADWLLTIYDRWNADGRPVDIRLYDSILGLLAGGRSQTEALGLEPADLVVVETDGAIEQADSLKVAYDGAPVTGFDVARDSFDAVLAHPGFAARSHGIESLCDTCRACPEVEVCGGGLYAHRYRAATGFLNPSVYCADLLKLITHVRRHRSLPLTPTPMAERRTDAAAPVHVLPDDTFDELAAGRGDLDAIRALVAAQHSLGRILLCNAVENGTAAGAGDAWGEAWDALSELDESAPAAVDTVLAHPYVPVWASRADAAVDYLWGIALAGALRAGRALTVTAPLGAALTLPTVGALRFAVGTGLPGQRRTRTITMEAGGNAATVDGRTVPLTRSGEGATAADRSDPAWLPLRSLEVPGWRVVLDDVDPYRACFPRVPAARQTAAEMAGWQRSLAAAWQLVDSGPASQAAALAAGLRTLTPLGAVASAGERPARRPAFGAVGVALPGEGTDSAADLARLLLSELQHLKMGAVLDLFELVQDDRSPRVEQALHSTYAQIADVEFWRTFAPLSTDAAARFRSLSDQTQHAVDMLAGSRALTPLGRRWVEGMRSTSHSWSTNLALQR